jgi:acyl-CoA synthetase (AMP-forming)/AMP-acid ligase II
VAIDLLLRLLQTNQGRTAVVWRDSKWSYEWLLDEIQVCRDTLDPILRDAQVVSVSADFSPRSIAVLLYLIEKQCVLVPLSVKDKRNNTEFERIAQVDLSISIDDDDDIALEWVTSGARETKHEYFEALRVRKHAGLVLFSSGSTGEPKAAVHDLEHLLDKFRVRRKTLVAVSFLMFDHIGGINTLFYLLSNGGTLVTIADRSPESVLSLIERYDVELLPTSPTFINLLLLGGSDIAERLASLKVLTYGTEPMPQGTLDRIQRYLPDCKIQQTYGLSEVGILRSKSESSSSLWVKLGGEGVQTRVVDGMLEILATSAMLGYLNAKSPFTEDGWFRTGDLVERKGEYLKILGRESNIINVGGQKVYPTEIENVIQGLDNISEVTVFGKRHQIMGEVVCATVQTVQPEPLEVLRRRIRKHCQRSLEKFKVPVEIALAQTQLHSSRYKKRIGSPNASG